MHNYDKAKGNTVERFSVLYINQLNIINEIRKQSFESKGIFDCIPRRKLIILHVKFNVECKPKLFHLSIMNVLSHFNKCTRNKIFPV